MRLRIGGWGSVDNAHVQRAVGRVRLERTVTNPYLVRRVGIGVVIAFVAIANVAWVVGLSIVIFSRWRALFAGRERGHAS